MPQITVLKYLNLGCGKRFHNDMVNVDFVSASKHVMQHDLTKGIPFADASFDVVYHSHVLEHFSQNDAISFMKECYRVLKHQGIIRIVVPDLETIAKLYLNFLDKATKNDPDAEGCYDWMLIEMYDQCLRTKSGGSVGNFFRTSNIAGIEFAKQRYGAIAQEFLNKSKNNSREKGNKTSYKLLLKKIRNYLLEKIIGSRYYNALMSGLFVNSGETHKWMYDKYSLARLLTRCNFTSINVVNAINSAIPNWNEFELDADHNGYIFKPDSIYIEARKN